MKEIGAFEAKNTLSALLDLVEAGEEVIITRHGERGDDRLPASDVALQKPQHPARREHIGLDLGESLLLRPGQGIGERAAHPSREMSFASKRPPRKLPVAAPDERDGELR